MNMMKTKTRPLSAYERWMVKSNLATIRDGKMTAEDLDAVLRANGYPRIADEVKEAHEANQKDQTQITKELRSA